MLTSVQRREVTIGNEQVSRGGATIRGEPYALPLGRLERWPSDHVDGFRGPLAAERFEGGQSNPTYKLVAATGNRYPYRYCDYLLLTIRLTIDLDLSTQAEIRINDADFAKRRTRIIRSFDLH